ncbi:hypothetical protein HanRHA438_Chr02g0088921 [Helianthus annuus]|nr:hypothetical protein HanRHA438_Chr02g0088921 [Helianthus annuus]
MLKMKWFGICRVVTGLHLVEVLRLTWLLLIRASYDGVLMNSLAAKDVVSWYMDIFILSFWFHFNTFSPVILFLQKTEFSCYSLLQEPFYSVPLIWTIHEKSLATRAARYVSNGQAELIDDWKAIFNRATVVVFPNYALPL